MLAPAAAERISALTPTLTPRPKFHVTRKLVGVPKWPLVLLTAVYTINVSDQLLLSSMFPLLKREFGLSDTALGILSGSFLISVTLGTVPFGALADRYSRTRIIAWGTAVAAIPPLNAARVDVLHPDLRGRGTSLDAVTQSLASAASPVIYGVIADVSDLRTAYVMLIPLAALAGLILLTFALASYRRDEQAVQEMVRNEHALHVASLAAADEKPAETARADQSAPAAGPRAESVAAGGLGGPEPEPDAANLEEGAEPVLQVGGLDFSYGPIQVLFGIDMTVPQGGCHALVGRNGVGKTTLLANIGGLLHAQSGQMFFRGQDLVGIPPEQRAKLGITLMAAGQSIFPSLSVRDNLWFGSYPFAGNQSLVSERLEEVLDVFQALSQRLNQRAGTLSGGASTRWACPTGPRSFSPPSPAAPSRC